MEKTFAEKYWKEFELLSLDFIKDQYKDSDAECIHTAFVHDNGIDGKITIPLTKETSSFVFNVISLIEAKLRTTSNINIHDYAASIIAAYNYSANVLYVLSNKCFTNGAKEITDTFSKKVNMKIILIDGKVILEWLHKTAYKCESSNFIQELSFSIMQVDHAKMEDDSSSDVTMSINNEYDANIFSEQPILGNTKLYGNKHRNVVKDICFLLKDMNSDSRIYVLNGDVGCGKTAILNRVGCELRNDGYMFNILDGNSAESLSVRSMYMWILKSLWGIDPLKLYRVEELPKFIDLICNSCENQIDVKVCETIKNIYVKNQDDIQNDMYTAYLVRYLDLILERHRGNNRSILAFENIHLMKSEVLDSFIPLIKCLVKNNVGILLELDSFTTTEVDTEKWERYYKDLKHIAAHNIIKIMDFEKDDAIDFLSGELPGLGMNYYEYILSHIGYRPIYLKHAIDWLKLHDIVVGTEDGTYYSVAKPSEFFNGITPDQNIRIIEDIILYYQNHKNNAGDSIHLRALFEATILMDGSVNFDLIKQLCPSESYVFITQNLIDTNLFILTHNSIQISHRLVLTALRNRSLPAYKQDVAHTIYTYLCQQEENTYIRCKKIDMLESMLEWDTFYSQSYHLGQEFLDEGEYEQSIVYFEKCINSYEKCTRHNHNSLLAILYGELYSYHKVGLGYLQHSLFNKYKKHLDVERKNTGQAIDASYLMMEKMYEARLAVANQYQLAISMMQYADENSKKIPGHFYAEVCFVYALIEKKYKSLSSAVKFLKQKSEKNPNLIALDIQYQSHAAAQYLNTEPERALPFYYNIVKYAGISKQYNKSIGHAYVDILTCYLLKEDWDGYDSRYKETLEYVQTNNQLVEEGRIYNLEGLYNWIKKQLSVAKDEFSNSQFYLGLTKNHNLSVLVRINNIGLYLELQERKKAALECRIASELIVPTYHVLFEQIDQTCDYYAHREYIGLLALMKYIRQLELDEVEEALLKTIPIRALKQHTDALAQGIYSDEVFKGTCIIHSGIIALTR